MKSWLSFLLLPAILPAADQPECAWMNAGTAAGILGAPADKKIVDPGMCEFADAKSRYVLRIEVKPAQTSLQVCDSHPVALRGIGNEAIACASKEGSGRRVERITGRVRDRLFVITLTTMDASATQDSLLEKAKSAAERVAGNLF